MQGAHFVIVGCGDAGTRVAKRLLARGSVTGVRRSATRDEPFPVLAWDLDASGAPPFEAGGAVLLYFVPPAREGRSDDRIARFLAALSGRPARLVYVSTTGVYGDRGGDAVDEDTPPAPQTDRAHRRLDAETRLRAWCEARGVAWVILRVPGIYGPGRLPLERLRRGEPSLVADEAGPGNRIHVDDLALACELAATAPQAAGRIYNVGDGDDISSAEFLALVSEIAGLPPPVLLPLEELRARRSAMALSFLGESRRVTTGRIRRELGFVPRYASAADGIRASLD